MNSSWLDMALRFVNFGVPLVLAALGGFVALNPPKDTSKKAYICLFAGLATIGLIASVWSDKIDRNEQARLQQENRQAESKFSSDLDAVKSSNDAILTFVSNLPKGVTPEQLTQFVKAFVKNREMSVPNQLEGMSTEDLISTTKTAAIQLRQLADFWKGEDQNQDNFIDEYTHYHPEWTQEQRQAAIEDAKDKKAAIATKFKSQAKDTIAFANDLRTEMLRRFPTLKNAKNTVIDGLFAKLMSRAYDAYDLDRATGYLDDLIKGTTP